MTSQNHSRDDFDRLMGQWMEADARVREPDRLLDNVLEQTRNARRIPGWLLPERWIPMQLTMRLQTVPRLAPVLLLLAALLLAGVLLILGLGAYRPLPAPFGPARNGVISYDTNAAIFVANADGTGARPLITSVPNASGARFSPDGTKVAFWGEGGPDSLYLANADGTGVRKASGDLWISTDKPITWAPDSRSVAFSSESGPDLRDEQIYLVDATATSPVPEPITDGRVVRALLPSWSPDAKWIAFIGIPLRNEPFRLWVVRPDGTDAHSLTTTRYVELATPQWAPSDKSLRLAYSAGAITPDKQDIFVFDLSSGVETAISTDKTDERWPAWSPDGAKLAWLVGGPPTQLRILTTDGSEPIKTITSEFMGAPVAWSPDGSKVYASNADHSQVTVVTVDGSVPNVSITHPRGLNLPDWQRLAP